MLTRRGFLAAGALLGGGFVAGCRRERATSPAGPQDAAPATSAYAVPAVGPAARPTLPRQGLALGGGRGADKEGGPTRYWLSVVDLDRGQRIAEIPTEFFPHGVAVHPNAPHVVMLFEKHGKGCCEVDLRARRVTETVRTIDGYEFYGHGAYSQDGRQLYCTETAVDDGYRGLLRVRDAASFEALGELPTGGKEPHDCVLIDGGKTLVVTNGGGHVDNGGEGTVTYVDLAAREVRHTLRFADRGLNAGHVAVTGRGELAIVSAPMAGLDPKDPQVHGALSFFSPSRDTRPRTVTDPIALAMRGETLSVAIHEPSMVVGATNPDGDLVTFWEFATGKLLKSHRTIPGARGIAVTLDQRYFVVTYGPSAALVHIDVKTLEPRFEGQLARSWITGSHVLCHDLAG